MPLPGDSETTARAVAESFVPPRVFETLIRPEHSVLIGPRGSGKTTLLKMLQPQALDHWDHPQPR